MNINIIASFVTVLCLVFGMTGCYEDLGNYNYSAINEVVIDTLEHEYNVVQFDTLEIAPFLAFTQNSTDNLAYEWEIDYELVAHSKDLTYRVENVKGGMPIRFKATNEATGVSYFQTSVLNALSYYSGGLSLLHERDGRYQAAFIRMAPENPGYVVDSMFARNGFDMGHAFSVTSSFTNDESGTGYYMVCDSTASGEYRVTMFDLNMNQFNQFDKAFVPKNVVEIGPTYQVVIGSGKGDQQIHVLNADGLHGNGTYPNDVSSHICPIVLPHPFMSTIQFPSFIFLKKMKDYSLITLGRAGGSRIYESLMGSNVIVPLGYDMVASGNVDNNYQYVLLVNVESGQAFILKVEAGIFQTLKRGEIKIPDHSFEMGSQYYLNAKDEFLFYTKGNQIHKASFGLDWSSDLLYQLEGSLEITCFYAAANSDVLYVGVYDSSSDHMNKGSLYVISQRNGSVIDVYKNCAGRITQMNYKKYNKTQEPLYSSIN